jgi:hypothetical protein
MIFHYIIHWLTVEVLLMWCYTPRISRGKNFGYFQLQLHHWIELTMPSKNMYDTWQSDHLLARYYTSWKHLT